MKWRNLEDAIGEMDILYMTRVQGERFADQEEYLRLRDRYILDAAKMKLAKPDMIVMHPLPRVNEIATEVDDDPRAAYFKQANFGRFVRMALILTMLETKPITGSSRKTPKCWATARTPTASRRWRIRCPDCTPATKRVCAAACTVSTSIRADAPSRLPGVGRAGVFFYRLFTNRP